MGLWVVFVGPYLLVYVCVSGTVGDVWGSVGCVCGPWTNHPPRSHLNPPLQVRFKELYPSSSPYLSAELALGFLDRVAKPSVTGGTSGPGGEAAHRQGGPPSLPEVIHVGSRLSRDKCLQLCALLEPSPLSRPGGDRKKREAGQRPR